MEQINLSNKAKKELKIYMALNDHKSKEKAINSILEDIYHA